MDTAIPSLMVLWIRPMAMEIIAIVMNWNMVLRIAMIMLMDTDTDMDTSIPTVSIAYSVSSGQPSKQTEIVQIPFPSWKNLLKVLQSTPFLMN